MKMKLKDVKPGMVIKSDRSTGYVMYIKTNKRLDSFYERDPYISLFDIIDFYDGPMSHVINPEDTVKIITGKKRAKIIKDIQKAQRSHIYQLEKNLRQLEAFEMIIEVDNENNIS